MHHQHGRPKTYEERSIIAYQQEGESTADAKKRLAQLWKEGKHPAQLRKQQHG